MLMSLVGVVGSKTAFLMDLRFKARELEDTLDLANEGKRRNGIERLLKIQK